MEWLGILIFVGITIYNSMKESNKAKQQREKRQSMGGQTVYRSPSAEMPDKPMQPVKPAVPKQPMKKAGNLFDSLTEFIGELENQLDSSQPQGKKKPEQKNTSAAGKGMTAAKKKKQKAAPQAAKKSPAELPKQTLMEQRPEREQREAHTKVSASVKPLQNAFDNQDACEHRIELNPNIQYSNRKRQTETARASIIRTDKDSLIQGIVWSEILGKPKAYPRRENVFDRH